MTPTLPEWTRVAWVNRDTQAWWSAVRREWAEVWKGVETESVAAGVREVAFQYCQPTELITLSAWAARNGLAVAPVSMAAEPREYSSLHEPATPGQPWQYRVLVGTPAAVRQALEAQNAQNHDRLGGLLGYPACCRAAFLKTWGTRQVDSTLEAGADGPPETNLWLRWLGVRLVPHLPCRQDCAASLALAQAFVELAQARGAASVCREALDMLAWPMDWSRLHGVAWVTTPALRISTRSDYTLTRDALRRQGVYSSPSRTRWTDNGFSDPGPMRDAHRAIVAALGGILRPGDRVADLGAGNGYLLRQIEDRYGVETVGVETNAEASARRLSSGAWLEGNLADVPWAETKPDVILLMPGRLLELDPTKADAVRAACLLARQIVVYAYADNLGPDGLAGLSVRAGLTGPILTLTDGPQHAIGLIAPPRPEC